MLEFFLILILVFVVWPLLRLYLAVRKAQKQARDAFSQFAGGGNAGDGGRRKAGWSGGRRKSRGKVIDGSVGEYVDFEEIDVKDENGDDREKKTSYRVEQQVVDAEWEDV